MPPINNRRSSKRPLLKRLISSSTFNRFSSCGGGGNNVSGGRSNTGIIGCGSWRRRLANLPDVHEPLPKQAKSCSTLLSRSSSLSESSSPPTTTTSNSLFFHHNPIASLPSSTSSSPSQFNDRSYPSFFDESGHKLDDDEEMVDPLQEYRKMIMMTSSTTTPNTTPAFSFHTEDNNINKLTVNGSAAFLSTKLQPIFNSNLIDPLSSGLTEPQPTTIPDLQYETTAAKASTTPTPSFPPPSSSSSSYSSSYLNKLALVGESVAIVKDSSDPYDDFKHSMLQMIVEREIYTKDGLQELLACFLRLNSLSHHEVIIKAFTDVWYSVVSPCAAPTITKAAANANKAPAPISNSRWR